MVKSISKKKRAFSMIMSIVLVASMIVLCLGSLTGCGESANKTKDGRPVESFASVSPTSVTSEENLDTNLDISNASVSTSTETSVSTEEVFSGESFLTTSPWAASNVSAVTTRDDVASDYVDFFKNYDFSHFWLNFDQPIDDENSVAFSIKIAGSDSFMNMSIADMFSFDLWMYDDGTSYLRTGSGGDEVRYKSVLEDSDDQTTLGMDPQSMMPIDTDTEDSEDLIYDRTETFDSITYDILKGETEEDGHPAICEVYVNRSSKIIERFVITSTTDVLASDGTIITQPITIDCKAGVCRSVEVPSNVDSYETVDGDTFGLALLASMFSMAASSDDSFSIDDGTSGE